MKLNKFDATNSMSIRTGVPSIGFGKGGAITLSKKFLEETGIKKPVMASIVQDEDTPEDWYVIIGDPDGFQTRENSAGGLAFNSSYVCKSFREFVSAEDVSVNCKLATHPAEIPKEALPTGSKAYGILTSTAVFSKKGTEE